MPTIQNLQRFPIYIKQQNPDWCIPASIEAVLKYHTFERHLDIDQARIIRIWESYCLRNNVLLNSMGFASLVPCLNELPELSRRFEIRKTPAVSYSNDRTFVFIEWLAIITDCIANNCPPIISIPIPVLRRNHSQNFNFTEKGNHVNVVLGYDDIHLFVHDPDPSIIKPHFIPKEYICNLPPNGDILEIRRRIVDCPT